LPSDSSTNSSEPPELTVFLDECIPIVLVEKLTVLLSDRPEKPKFVHLLQLMQQGTQDPAWATRCKKAGWLPITKDSSRSNRGPKLAKVAASIGLFYVVISPNVASQKAHELARCIVCLWPEILAAYRSGAAMAKVLRNSSGLGYRLHTSSASSSPVSASVPSA
jgi:hypothetical protein